MIKIEDVETYGWEAAIRGMRNPMNSWDKSDSDWTTDYLEGSIMIASDDEDWYEYKIGPNDQKLMKSLAKAGSTHAKYRRMIMVSLDITAPLYWWKEFDTYKVGTVANSCSTMHKLHAKEFTFEDFSCEGLMDGDDPNLMPAIAIGSGFGDTIDTECIRLYPKDILHLTIVMLNNVRRMYLQTKRKDIWDQMNKLLPDCYNQKRTVMLNYEVLSHMYHDRKEHKLDEWRDFCKLIETLPFSEIITGEEKENDAGQTAIDVCKN
jgi:hypothetical protein